MLHKYPPYNFTCKRFSRSLALAASPTSVNSLPSRFACAAKSFAVTSPCAAPLQADARLCSNSSSGCAPAGGPALNHCLGREATTRLCAHQCDGQVGGSAAQVRHDLAAKRQL